MTLSRLQKQKTAMKPTIRIESSSERFILCTHEETFSKLYTNSLLVLLWRRDSRKVCETSHSWNANELATAQKKNCLLNQFRHWLLWRLINERFSMKNLQSFRCARFFVCCFERWTFTESIMEVQRVIFCCARFYTGRKLLAAN